MHAVLVVKHSVLIEPIYSACVPCFLLLINLFPAHCNQAWIIYWIMTWQMTRLLRTLIHTSISCCREENYSTGCVLSFEHDFSCLVVADFISPFLVGTTCFSTFLKVPLEASSIVLGELKLEASSVSSRTIFGRPGKKQRGLSQPVSGYNLKLHDDFITASTLSSRASCFNSIPPPLRPQDWWNSRFCSVLFATVSWRHISSQPKCFSTNFATKSWLTAHPKRPPGSSGSSM